MSTINEPYNILILKRRVVLAMLSLATIGATIATFLHRLQPHPHSVYLIAPPLLAISSLLLLIRLYKKPESLQQVMHLSLLAGVLFVVVPSWFYTLKAIYLRHAEAIASSDTTLVGSLPPVTPALFVLTLVMLIALRRRQQLVIATLFAWMAIAAPILIYLLLYPQELRTSRGLDLFISLGPTMGIQILLILFYNRVQDIVERLYTERLQYYAQIVERQAIRQQAIEQAFTQIHNGPLQTLALLLQDVQREQVPSQQLLQRLEELNAEIRAVGRSLTDEVYPDTLQTSTSEQTLRLGEGTCIDLNRPLHNLLHEVYALTLKRNLPYFKTIKVKVRNFAPLEQSTLTLEMKRDLCLWLEEALCNVGKHALGTTRIVVTGQHHEGKYILKVQDNGVGLNPGQEQQGTKQGKLLAQRLGGQFRRESLPKGGAICELSWSVELV